MDYKSNKKFRCGAQIIIALIYIMLADMYLFRSLTFLLAIFSLRASAVETSRTPSGFDIFLEVYLVLRLLLLMLRLWEVY